MASRPFFDKRRGSWAMKYRAEAGGPWVRVVLCKHPDPWSASRPPKKPPQEAVDRARHYQELEYRAVRGIGPKPDRARDLAEYLDGYAAAHALSSVRASNVRLRAHLRRFAEFAKGRGAESVQAVGRATCRDYLEWRLAAGIAHATLRTERGYLMGAWTRAMEDEIVSSNPWRFAAAPGRPADTSITFWTPEEIARIVEACAKPWHRDFALVLAHTGLRSSTALAMEWSWVRWADGTIRIAEAEGVKTRYTTMIGGRARDVLQRMAATGPGSGLVFPDPRNGGGRIPYGRARWPIMRAIEKAGVPPGTLHDFRHSYARRLVLSGVPITVVKSQLGHSDLKTTMRYITTNELDAARFLENL